MRAGIFGISIALLISVTAAAEVPVFDLTYEATLLPTNRSAEVSLQVEQPRQLLVRLKFRTDPERQRDFVGDGKVEVDGEFVTWTVPKSGGRLNWTFRIDHQRGEGGFDARSAADWTIFRSDDLVPPATAVMNDGARSTARLRIRAPTGWSTVTRYPRAADRSFIIENPDRRFLRPTGWLLAGDGLGVVRERVSGTSLAVAAPAGQNFRRLDILALLRWTLPELTKILDDSPSRLLIIGAGNPMWRGGLSGPSSVFLHADRPLITPDVTSPLLHEMMHTVLPPADEESDWLAEGLAERYALELMVRSRTISRSRHEKALGKLAAKGKQVRTLAGGESSGPKTARAVGFLEVLDREIRSATEDAASLDDVVRALRNSKSRLSVSALRREAEAVSGSDLSGIFLRYGLNGSQSDGETSSDASSDSATSGAP